MPLCGQHLLSIVHNALDCGFDERGRLCFRRFTPEQIADYALDGEQFPVRCRASANVTLDFVTDASWFGFEYDAREGSSQRYCGFDLFVDGVLYDARLIGDLGSNGVMFALPEGTHRVTVFLPWSAELIIRSTAVSDGAFVRPAPPKKLRILVIGDSITQGYIARHPGFTWVGKLTRDLDAEVLNQGVGGYGFYRASLNHPIRWDPDLIILTYGANDYAREITREGFRRCAEEYMEAFDDAYPDTPVLQTLPIYRGDEKSVCRDRIREYTREDALQIQREIAAGRPRITVMEDTHFPRTPDFFAPDLLHPNDMGFLVHGERVVRAVRAMGLPGTKGRL